MKQEAKKTAIITGSGRGIGKETAIILAKKSLNVLVCSRYIAKSNPYIVMVRERSRRYLFCINAYF